MFIGVNAVAQAAVSWLEQQHRRTRQAVYPEHCSSALVFGVNCMQFIGVNAVAQGCCQLLGTAAQKNKAGSLPWCSSAAVSWFGTAAQKNKAGSLP